MSEIYDTLHPSEEDKSSLTKSGGKFTESQLVKLNEALLLAQNSITDPLFEKILRAQSDAGVYSWGRGRLDSVPEPHRKEPLEFFLSEFRTRGLPSINDFIARDGYENDDVTGSTKECSVSINFNVDNLDRSSRTAVFVSGTIVHERVHSFCYKHRSQDVGEEYNLCDFAYHAGHLAIVIALYKANGSKPVAKPGIKICKSLVKRLRDEKILKEKD